MTPREKTAHEVFARHRAAFEAANGRKLDDALIYDRGYDQGSHDAKARILALAGPTTADRG